MIRVEFPDAAGGGRAFALRCHVISSFDKYAFFLLGTGTLPFPPYRLYCRPSRPPKLCSRLHKYTMFRHVCQVADYINVHVSGIISIFWGEKGILARGGMQKETNKRKTLQVGGDRWWLTG